MRRSALVLSMFVGGAAAAGCSQWRGFDDKRAEAQERFDQHKARFKFALALEQFENGRVQEAERSMRETLALHPDETAYLLLLAKIELERGELARAAATLSKITYQGPPVAEHHYVAGLLAERYGRSSEALSHFEEAQRAEPLNRECLMACAETLVSLGRAPEALEMVERALADFDGHWSLHALRGDILQILGDAPRAADAFTQALLQNPDDDQLELARALALHDAGRHVQALAALRALDERLDDQVPASVLRALAHSSMEIGDLLAARASLRRLTGRSQEDACAWLLLARCELALGNLASAQRAAERAAGIEAQRPAAHTLLGYLHLRRGELDEAGHSLRQALRCDAQDVVALSLLGRLAERQGQPAVAQGFYAQLLELAPRDPLASGLLEALQQDGGRSAGQAEPPVHVDGPGQRRARRPRSRW